MLEETVMGFDGGEIRAVIYDIHTKQDKGDEWKKEGNGIKIKAELSVDTLRGGSGHRGLMDLIGFLCRTAFLKRYFERCGVEKKLNKKDMDELIKTLRRELIVEIERDMAMWLRSGQIHVLHELGEIGEDVSSIYGVGE